MDQKTNYLRDLKNNPFDHQIQALLVAQRILTDIGCEAVFKHLGIVENGFLERNINRLLDEGQNKRCLETYWVMLEAAKHISLNHIIYVITTIISG